MCAYDARIMTDMNNKHITALDENAEPMTYHHEYRLRQPTPAHPAGCAFRWDGIRRKFFPVKPNEKYNTDRESLVAYTVEQVQDSDWFLPEGEPLPFIPPFPRFDALGDSIRLTAETRLVDRVDICRTFNDLLDSPGFERRLYEFYKTEYNKFYGLG